MTSTREIGDKFEERCQSLLGMRPTYGSGACIDDADLKDDHLIVECKVRTKVGGINIPPALIDKVNAQAIKWRRDWAIATQTMAGQFITMPLDVFAEIYQGYLNGTEEED